MLLDVGSVEADRKHSAAFNIHACMSVFNNSVLTRMIKFGQNIFNK
jgi:hypothetical protein